MPHARKMSQVEFGFTCKASWGSDCLDCQFINLSAQAFSGVKSATLLPTCQLYAFEEKSTAAEMCPSRRQKLARPSPLCHIRVTGESRGSA